MKDKSRKILLYFAIIIGVILVLDLFLLIPNLDNIQDLEKEAIKNDNNQRQIKNISMGNFSKIDIKIPAIDNKGEGVPTSLIVERMNGTGRTLTDINNILFWADTQQSIRMARLVAENMTGIDPDDYDLVYSIEANASVIGGPSAGAAVTLATIGALTGEQPNRSVMITGRVNHDGSIGPVSSILEKAKASKKAGADLFLVPLLQSRDVIYKEESHCEKFGNTEICQSETIPVKIDIANRTGIKVKEVGSIKEAREYFFN